MTVQTCVSQYGIRLLYFPVDCNIAPTRDTYVLFQMCEIYTPFIVHAGKTLIDIVELISGIRYTEDFVNITLNLFL